MKAPVYDMSGKILREVDLPESVFALEPNVGVMHQALVRQEANARAGTHQTQTRADVSRTTAKWFRQKGTGRARHGSRSAPTFVGGGVAHGPHPRSYAKKMPRKMRRLALACALSVKAAGDAVALVENMRLDVPQTKAIRALIAAAAPGQKTLFVLAGPNQNVERSIRNLEGARYCGPDQLNIRDVLRHDKVLIDTEALDGLAARLDRGKKESADA